MSLISYALVNAVLRHQEFPETFLIPDATEIARLKPGDMVKVSIEIHGLVERFFLTILKAEEGYFFGRVDNDMFYTEFHGLIYRDIIKFYSFNILAILRQEEFDQFDPNTAIRKVERHRNNPVLCRKFDDFKNKKDLQ